MNVKLTDENIAIINDALKHVESTTDVYSNLQINEMKSQYKDAFIDTINKIKSISNEKTSQGAYYFAE